MKLFGISNALVMGKIFIIIVAPSFIEGGVRSDKYRNATRKKDNSITNNYPSLRGYTVWRRIKF